MVRVAFVILVLILSLHIHLVQLIEGTVLRAWVRALGHLIGPAGHGLVGRLVGVDAIWRFTAMHIVVWLRLISLMLYSGSVFLVLLRSEIVGAVPAVIAIVHRAWWSTSLR